MYLISSSAPYHSAEFQNINLTLEIHKLHQGSPCSRKAIGPSHQYTHFFCDFSRKYSLKSPKNVQSQSAGCGSFHCRPHSSILARQSRRQCHCHRTLSQITHQWPEYRYSKLRCDRDAEDAWDGRSRACSGGVSSTSLPNLGCISLALCMGHAKFHLLVVLSDREVFCSCFSSFSSFIFSNSSVVKWTASALSTTRASLML